MRPGDYVVGQRIMLDDNNNPIVIGSAHRVQDELEKTLREMADERKQNRMEHVIVAHRDSYGWKLPQEKLEQRAALVLRYKGVRPIWIFQDHRWVKYKRCIDFKSPGMHIRCVDDNNDICVFDPDKVTIATQDERTRHIAVIRQKQLRKDINSLNARSIELRKRALQLEEHIGSLGKEADRIDKLLRRSDAESRRHNRKWRHKKDEQSVKNRPRV